MKNRQNIDETFRNVEPYRECISEAMDLNGKMGVALSNIAAHWVHQRVGQQMIHWNTADEAHHAIRILPEMSHSVLHVSLHFQPESIFQTLD